MRGRHTDSTPSAHYTPLGPVSSKVEGGGWWWGPPLRRETWQRRPLPGAQPSLSLGAPISWYRAEISWVWRQKTVLPAPASWETSTANHQTPSMELIGLRISSRYWKKKRTMENVKWGTEVYWKGDRVYIKKKKMNIYHASGMPSPIWNNKVPKPHLFLFVRNDDLNYICRKFFKETSTYQIPPTSLICAISEPFYFFQTYQRKTKHLLVGPTHCITESSEFVCMSRHMSGL